MQRDAELPREEHAGERTEQPPALASRLQGRRRVPGVVWDAVVEARAVLEEARAAASRIVAAAREETEALRSAAVEEGRAEGLGSLTEAYARAVLDRDRLLESSRAELVDLAFAVAERVIGAVVQRHPEIVTEAAAAAVEASRGRCELIIRANSEDLPRLRASEAQLVLLAQGSPRLRFVADDGLARGGAVVDTELGRVDASIEVQLAALRRAVERTRGAAS